jgi:hypothetical protein
MYVYALAKGVRMGYIDSVYLETATTGYQGILDKFLFERFTGLTLRNVCVGTIVGPDYAYYVDRQKGTGGHADGAFILASIEMEMMDSVYPPGLLGIDSVVNGAIGISWNNNQNNILGYILERKTDGDFTEIADLGAEITSYTDSQIEPNTVYIYRISAYTQNDTSRWSNYLKVTAANTDGLPSPAYLPFPANEAENIKAGQVLKWKKGLLTDYHQVYFGTTDPPPFVADVDDNAFTPEDLQSDSVYYWRIDEVTEKGVTVGETWKFDMEKSVGASFPRISDAPQIHPNPASEKFFVERVEAGSTVSVYDLNGRLFFSEEVEKDGFEIDCRLWKKGTYVVQVSSAESILTAMLIKN